MQQYISLLDIFLNPIFPPACEFARFIVQQGFTPLNNLYSVGLKPIFDVTFCMPE